WLARVLLLCLLAVLFLFFWSASPFVLHSFPTRRSSDLVHDLNPLAVGRDPLRDVADDRDPIAERDHERAQVEHDRAAFGADDRADRKSTRLNSSHVANSYAVFCLKKKNNWNNQTYTFRN